MSVFASCSNMILDTQLIHLATVSRPYYRFRNDIKNEDARWIYSTININVNFTKLHFYFRNNSTYIESLYKNESHNFHVIWT